MPGVNAAVVAVLESTGGLMFTAGLATRVMSAVLSVVLLVAVLTAHRGDVSQLFSDPGQFIAAAPIPYMAICLVLATTGAGRFSVDHVLLGKGNG